MLETLSAKEAEARFKTAPGEIDRTLAGPATDPNTFAAKDAFIAVKAQPRVAFINGKIRGERPEPFLPQGGFEMLGGFLKVAGIIPGAVRAIYLVV
jgi:hypothetical protein